LFRSAAQGSAVASVAVNVVDFLRKGHVLVVTRIDRLCEESCPSLTSQSTIM
jgi:hypothetical protein